MLIGDGGKDYFNRCWRTSRDGGGGRGVDDVVDYEAIDTTDTNHESITDVLKGAMTRIFEEVREGWREGLTEDVRGEMRPARGS